MLGTLQKSCKLSFTVFYGPKIDIILSEGELLSTFEWRKNIYLHTRKA